MQEYPFSFGGCQNTGDERGDRSLEPGDRKRTSQTPDGG